MEGKDKIEEKMELDHSFEIRLQYDKVALALVLCIDID